MAQTNQPTSGEPAVVKVEQDGAHDRVAMLSLRADGTPDQYAPEIIGDKAAAVEAAKRQFADQAVSAVDQAERGVTAADGGEQLKQDPSIASLEKAHEKAATAAEKAAEKIVGDLHQG